MRALSVRAPWWFAILHGKPVENRGWYTQVRGRIWLHASAFWNNGDIQSDWEDVEYMASKDGIEMPPPNWGDMRRDGGHIVGSIEIYDCVRFHPSAFFVGKYGFLLRARLALPRPVPFKGALGFFEVPDNIFSGENDGHGLQAAMSAHGMHEPDRSEAQNR
jgi:hypothetical protein